MKTHLKSMIPQSAKLAVKRQKFKPAIGKLNRYRTHRELHFSSNFRYDRTAYLAGLMVTAHVLEKGITMPGRRLGFGYDRVRDIITRTSKAVSNWGGQFVEIQSTLADLRQYYDLHREANFQLPADISQGIEKLLPHLAQQGENCYTMSREQYYQPYADFEQFALSRHSVRWFSDQPVSEELLLKAIHLAQTAPSACNRQATRVKVIADKQKKLAVCNLQNGNRGFGDNADKWLLITSEQGAWSYRDTNSAYIDAGIFTMNLLYALHHYGIVACTLNAHLDPPQQKQLQQLLGYPESEMPIVFIAIGMPTDEFMIAKSQRLNLEDIVQII